jgi:hypothetical protein
MKKQSDLFRWILGGLTIAGVAVAASTPPTVSPSPPPPAASAPQTQAAESASATASVQAPQAASKQSSQIWECTTNGVKTFSDNPCGTKATRVALRPINTMKPTPVIRSTRADGSDPRYTKEYTDQNLYPDQDASAQGFDDNSYPVDQGYQGYQGFYYAPLNRPDHRRRPERHHDHDASSEPQKSRPQPHNSAPAPHRSMPVPQRN